MPEGGLFRAARRADGVAPTGRGLRLAGRHAAALLGYVTLVRQIGPHFAALENLGALATSGTLGNSRRCAGHDIVPN